jgi:ATP-binding protein involved in chromosome partitioning
MENSTITTPADLERSQQDLMIKRNLKKIKRKIIVMSGKGGVGKSTVAGAIAMLLSERGKKVGLLDVDLHGPSIPNIIKVKGGLNISKEGDVQPYEYSETLKIVSMGMLMQEQDTAVIWRGPLKISAIRQFISDITWGDLDYLIVDSPPGTGDEPLTVAQTITDAEALIVTTPQEISLADVRKSITFCRQVKLEILGVVENMSDFSCPHCGEAISLFGKGGGAKMASQMNVPMLGEIPIDPKVVLLSDTGGLETVIQDKGSALISAYDEIIDKIKGKE